MDLHGEIMNIKENCTYGIAYRIGHRDARHAAAELSLKYLNYIEELENIARSVLCDSEEVLQQLREECGID